MRPYESDNRVHMMIRYESDLNQLKYERAVYGYLDWLGDLGGFKEALSWFGILFVMLTTFQPLNNLLVQKLFFYQSSKRRKRKTKKQR